MQQSVRIWASTSEVRPNSAFLALSSITLTMLTSLAILAALAPSAMAGMYSAPVVNLDAKTFKQALSVEHAAVRPHLPPR